MEVISPGFLYLWTRLDSVVGIGQFFAVFGFLSVLVCLFWFFATRNTFFNRDEDKEAWYKLSKRGLIISILMFLLGGAIQTVVPNSKDAAIIYVIPKIANNQALQEEFTEIYQFGKQAFKEKVNSYLPKEEK